MVLGDTVERTKICSTLGHNANFPCHNCTIPKSELGTIPANVWKRRTKAVFERFVEQALNRNDISYLQKQTGLRIERNLFHTHLPYFDVFRDVPIDLFHVEIIGLLKRHFSLLRAKCKTPQLLSILEDKLVEKCGSKFHLKKEKFWQGRDWITLSRSSKDLWETLTSYEFSQCWNLHITCINTISLAELSLQRGYNVSLAYHNLRVKMANLHQFKTPNFHYITHLWDFFQRFGPPRLYWCEPWERKHRTFKTSAAKSCDFKSPQNYLLRREEMMQNLRCAQQAEKMSDILKDYENEDGDQDEQEEQEEEEEEEEEEEVDEGDSS